MARPKEKTSLAFQQKCAAAGDKLRKFQADRLREDMERLFTEELHADLTVELQHRKLSLHSLMLKARSPSLFKMMMSLPGSCHDNKYVSMINCSQATEIEHLFRQIYKEDAIQPLLDQLVTIIDNPEATHDTETPAISPQSDTPEVNDNSNQELNTATRNTDSEERIIVQNGDLLSTVNVNEMEEDTLYVLAKKIVKKTIRDAIAIVDQSKDLEVEMIGTGVVVNGLLDSEIDDKTGVKMENITSHTLEAGNKHNGCIRETTGIENGDQLDKKCESKKLGCKYSRLKIKPAKESCLESVSSLLERLYGMQTAVKPCSQLGEDLLRLLGQELSDCVVEVQTESFHVHRCVLAARSSYFDAMLGGSWRESDEEHIVLEGIDPSVMRQTLLYMYGGVVEVDPQCTLGGLIMMADMYAMEGLKEVVAFNLNKEYCHFFHRPCQECIAGVPDALALTMIYNMDALKDKCVKWINKNFGKVWATQTFAMLPQEVLEFCASTAVKDLALDNVIETMVECRRLNEKTPHLKWTEPIFHLITRLMDAAIEFASQNFVHLVSSNTFRKIDKEGIAFNRQPLEDIFGVVIQALSPENSCQAYLSLNKWVSMFKAREEEKETIPLYSQEFTDFVEYLFKKCKGHLCLYIHQAANTAEWGILSKDMQTELMREASYVCIDVPSKGRMAPPKLTSMQKKTSATSPLSLKEYFDRHFGHRDSQPSHNKSPHGSKSKLSGIKGLSPSTGRSSSMQKKEKRPNNINETASRNNSSSFVDLKSKAKLGETKLQRSRTFVKSSTPSEKTAVQPSIPSNVLQRTSKTEPKEKAELPKLDKTRLKSHSTKTENNRDIDHVFASSGHMPKIRGDSCEKVRDADRSHNALACKAVDSEYFDNPKKDEETVRRSQSSEAEIFQPHFGENLQSAQSVDSFFDSREGQRTIVQRPIPALEVKFIAPHEFYESF